MKKTILMHLYFPQKTAPEGAVIFLYFPLDFHRRAALPATMRAPPTQL